MAVIDDLGSGAVEPLGDEPVLRRAIAAGADLVCASADKLLGGPQAGIVVGTAAAVDRCRNHPLARALRLDKMQIAALEETLRIHRDGGAEAIPALAMLALGEAELGARARALAELAGPRARVIESAGRPGGGTLPLTELPGPVWRSTPAPGGRAARGPAPGRASTDHRPDRRGTGRARPAHAPGGPGRAGRRDRGAAPCLIRAPLPGRERMVLGTAGHIDHGKTALIGALTGTDTDRLEEERRRGISIELGFAELPLPDGRTIGVVDVPGHERLSGRWSPAPPASISSCSSSPPTTASCRRPASI